MKKKERIALSTTLIASTFALACAALIYAKTAPSIKAKGTPVVDSWTEKAYEAPTGSDVGYKHYYLGCPGNARTSDAEHNVEVSLEEITIPALNVIERSAVAPGSEISNIVDGKIKHCDQATTYSADGGTPVFVEDQGRQALFFSRSGNLGEGEVVGDTNYTEFRFEKNFSKLTSVTFEYRYLDYNTWAPAGAQHIRTEVKSNGAYLNHDFAFVNDDAWHTGTIYYNELSITHLLFIVSDFQGHLFISNIEYHGFDELGLDAATGVDAIAPVTLSDMGIGSSALIPSHASGHVFGSYDYHAKKGIDLWFQYKYENESANWMYFYLFNQDNEEGIVFRLDNRNENDGYTPMYVYTTRAYGAGSTVVAGAGNTGTSFWIPKWAGLKTDTTNYIHVTAICIDDTNNTYRVSFSAGIAGGTMYYPNDLPEGNNDNGQAHPYFDIELGETYFDGGAHRRIRFSSTSATRNTIMDANSQERFVVYQNAAGDVIGKKNAATVSLFEYGQQGKKLVGWFNQHGERVNDGDPVYEKLFVRPVLVDLQDDMIVPSTLMLGTPGSWYNVDSSTPGELASEIGYAPSGNRIDLYFIYQPTLIPDDDHYAIFGFPYDFKDGQSRLLIRLNENDNGRLDGYMYGPSTTLGNAGAEGTYYNIAEGFRRSGDYLLIHVSVVDNGESNITLGLEVANLRTGQVGSTSKTLTFNLYDISDAARNKMMLTAPIGCEWRFTDAF